MPTPDELNKMLNDAEHIAHEAAVLLKSMQGTQTLVNQKDIVDLSTTADVAAENLIVSYLKDRYPDHNFFAEEAGQSEHTSDYRWVIDPLDGTKEYVKGDDDFNVLIALEYQENLILGVAYRAVNNAIYTTAKGKGSFVNGARIHPSTISSEETAIVSYRLPKRGLDEKLIKREMTIMNDCIRYFYRVRSLHDDAYCLAMVARGFSEGHVLNEKSCSWYDVAPAILLVEEAGGKVTDYYGNSIKCGDLSKGIVASNGLIHDKLLALISTHI